MDWAILVYYFYPIVAETPIRISDAECQCTISLRKSPFDKHLLDSKNYSGTKHDQTRISPCISYCCVDPRNRGCLYRHDRAHAQMARQPGCCHWLYAGDCPSHFGKCVGVVSTPEYERTGLFRIEDGRGALFTLPGVEY